MSSKVRILLFILAMVVLLGGVFLEEPDKLEFWQTEDSPVQKTTKQTPRRCDPDWECIYRCYDAECARSCVSEGCLLCLGLPKPKLECGLSDKLTHRTRFFSPEVFFPPERQVVFVEPELNVKVVELFRSCVGKVFSSGQYYMYNDGDRTFPIAKVKQQNEEAIWQESQRYIFLKIGRNHVFVFEKEGEEIFNRDFIRGESHLEMAMHNGKEITVLSVSRLRYPPGFSTAEHFEDLESSDTFVPADLPDRRPLDPAIPVDRNCYSEFAWTSVIDGHVFVTDGSSKAINFDERTLLGRLEKTTIPIPRLKANADRGVYKPRSMDRKDEKVVFNLKTYILHTEEKKVDLGEQFRQPVWTDWGLFFRAGRALMFFRNGDVLDTLLREVEFVRASSDGQFIGVVHKEKGVRTISWWPIDDADRINEPPYLTAPVPFDEPIDDIDFFEGPMGSEIVFLANGSLITMRDVPYKIKRLAIEAIDEDLR